MFIFTDGKTPLEVSIECAHAELQALDPHSEEYGRAVDNISRLEKIQLSKRMPSLSPDTIIIAATNLLGIILILNHERAGNFIGTKALSFVPKPRI